MRKRAEPQCRVSVGTRYRVPARARVLDRETAAAVPAGYRVRHPRANRELSGLIEEATGRGIETVPLVESALRT